MNVEAEVDSSVSLHVLGNQKCCVLHPSQAKNITHWPSCHVFARTEALNHVFWLFLRQKGSVFVCDQDL